jgi:hypothetical protein
MLPRIDDPPSNLIRNNPKYWPFFAGALGAIDGTHINCCPSSIDRHAMRNRKGGVSQNCLACVSFEMKFLYFLSGWEGSTADATMYSRSHFVDFRVPAGKYYLADAGFGICDALLVPYRGIRYHLAEWGRADTQYVSIFSSFLILITSWYRPANKEELYNLRHACARNVVERIFGVVKNRWSILTRPPHFNMSVQAEIPPALAALHNFIMDVDPDDYKEYLADNDEEDGLGDFDPNPGHPHESIYGDLATSVVQQAEKERATIFRDEVAQAMWRQYQNVLAQRNN